MKGNTSFLLLKVTQPQLSWLAEGSLCLPVFYLFLIWKTRTLYIYSLLVKKSAELNYISDKTWWKTSWRRPMELGCLQCSKWRKMLRMSSVTGWSNSGTCTRQVWPLTQFFQTAFCIINWLGGQKINYPSLGRILLSFVFPGLRPLKGFLSWHDALQGPSTSSVLLLELKRYKDNIRCVALIAEILCHCGK